MSTFAELKRLTFSRLEQPKSQKMLCVNLLKASLQLTCQVGALALISFVFNRYLPSNSPWTPLCQPLTSYLVTSLGTVLSIAIYLRYALYKKEPTPACALNQRIFIIEMGSILIGFFGVAALGTNFLKISQKTSSQLLASFLGFSLMGSIHSFFHLNQIRELRKAIRKS